MCLVLHLLHNDGKILSLQNNLSFKHKKGLYPSLVNLKLFSMTFYPLQTLHMEVEKLLLSPNPILGGLTHLKIICYFIK